MKESSRNLLVGLFVAAAMVVFGILMVWFGEAPTWLGGSAWTLRITDVSGLGGISEGTTVRLNGVEIGRVKRLGFLDPKQPHQGVVIEAGIQKAFSVPADAKARVYGATLGFGTGRIEIICDAASHAPPLDKKSASIKGEMRSVIGELIKTELGGVVEDTIVQVGKLAEAAAPVAKNLALLIEQRSVAQIDNPQAGSLRVQANLSTVIERIDYLVANLNTVLGDQDVQGNVKAVVADLKTTAETLRKTIDLLHTRTQTLGDSLQTGINQTNKNLEASFAKLNRVLDHLDEAASSSATLLHGVDQGQGTLGRLARDDRLYEAAVLTLDRMSELIATLQRIIGKAEEDGYIKVGKATPVGTLKADVPIGKVTAKVLSRISGNQDTEPLLPPSTSSDQ